MDITTLCLLVVALLAIRMITNLTRHCNASVGLRAGLVSVACMALVLGVLSAIPNPPTGPESPKHGGAATSRLPELPAGSLQP